MRGSRPEGLRAVVQLTHTEPPEPSQSKHPLGSRRRNCSRSPFSWTLPAGKHKTRASRAATTASFGHLRVWSLKGSHRRQRTAQITAFLQQLRSHHGLFVPDTTQPVSTLITPVSKEAGRRQKKNTPGMQCKGPAFHNIQARRDAGRGCNECSTTAGKAPMLRVGTERTL